MIGAMRPGEPQILIFDADDTLWENNVVFEQVIDDFVDWLAHPTLEPGAVRAILAEIEEANIVAHGYGSTVFLRSLADCFTRLMQRPLGPAEQQQMAEFTAAFASGRVELIPQVAEVLDELRERHELYLLTKGVPDEQQHKIDSSGLGRHFAAVDIVPAKDPQTYRTLLTRRGLDPGRSWMIGNSPRSDIIAAREAGLRAVFIPNANTWAHEHAELDPGDGGILHLATFAELTRHF
jgi:putative hydrolase of the HAD superfamily